MEISIQVLTLNLIKSFAQKLNLTADNTDRKTKSSLHGRWDDKSKEGYADPKAALSVEGIISARIGCVKIDF